MFENPNVKKTFDESETYFNFKKTDALDIFSLGRFRVRLRTSIKTRYDFPWTRIFSILACVFHILFASCVCSGEQAISIYIFSLLYSDCKSIKLVILPKI